MILGCSVAGESISTVREKRRWQHSLANGRRDLSFRVVNVRYECGAVILTYIRGFSERSGVFSETVVTAALVEGMLDYAFVIEMAGNIYRLREVAKLSEQLAATARLGGDQAEQTPCPASEGKIKRKQPIKQRWGKITLILTKHLLLSA